MLKRIKKIACFTICLMLIFSFSAQAAGSNRGAYDTYTYSYGNNGELLSATAYIPTKIIDGKTLGVGDLRSVNDIFIDEENGSIFIADTDNNRVIMADIELKNVSVINGVMIDGKLSEFSSPNGLYRDNKGLLYVADTGNKRVIRMTVDGELDDIFTVPKIKQFEELEYKPKKVAVSKQGDIYITCEGVYEGIISLDYNGEFEGFSGTNTVNPSAWDLFWYKFSTKEQKDSMVSFLPVTFLNMDMDGGEFVYAVSQYENGTTSLVKKLNPGGNDVLRNNSGQLLIGDLGNLYYGMNIGNSNFSDICYIGNGMYVCTDMTRNRLFLYNSDGEMVFAFGRSGNQLGNLSAPSAIDNNGWQLYVADSVNNNITVFTPTEYGTCMLNGISAYYDGEFDKANGFFERAFQYNTNCEIAYLGIGKIQLRNGEFSKALTSFRLANNASYYSKALQKQRDSLIDKYFTLIFIAAVAAAVLAVVAFVVKKYRKAKLKEVATNNALSIWSESTDFAFFCMFHPFQGFDDMKREKKGTLSAAVTVLLLFTIGSVMMASMKGFLFGANDNVNIWLEIAKAVLPIVLFCIVNWGITTLFEGEGSMKYIFMSTCYALLPMALVQIPLITLSNVLTLDEASVYYTVLSIFTVYTVLLLLIGNMTVHNFSMKKTVLMALTTLLGMAIIVFILFLFVNLWYEIVALIAQVIKEIEFRI